MYYGFFATCLFFFISSIVTLDTAFASLFRIIAVVIECITSLLMLCFSFCNFWYFFVRTDFVVAPLVL